MSMDNCSKNYSRQIVGVQYGFYLLHAIRICICFIRYEAANSRKSKILGTIRALELPNNPLDDIIDQVRSMFPHDFIYIYLYRAGTTL